MPTCSGLYTTFPDMIRSIRSTWEKGSVFSETQVMSAYASVDLLVVDEVGVQYGTDSEKIILCDVLDRRYRDMQSTLLLTNLDKSGFSAAVGDRVFDRLTQTARWVPFDWPSYRPEARKESL